MNVNLAATYFCAQKQMGQIEFHKLLVKTLTYNNHCHEDTDETPEKSANSSIPAIVSSHSHAQICLQT